jgi:hypothetical protein
MRAKRSISRIWIVTAALVIIAVCYAAARLVNYRIRTIEAAYLYGMESYCDPDAVQHSQAIGDEIVAALEAYREGNGVYPEDLTQLVPSYLPELRNPTAGNGEWSYYRDAEEHRMRLAFGVGNMGWPYPCYYWDSAEGRWREDS